MMSSTLLLAASALAFTAAFAMAEPAAPSTQPTSVLDFTVKDNAGKDVPLSTFKGKVMLIVNTASKCGNTPQYAGMEKLYTAYGSKGLAILAFPANDFGKQEPGTDGQIREFCTGKYNVTFDLFSKIVVKGEGQAPLYQFLTSKATDPKFAGPIGWNFAKFLIDRDGKVVARFDPKTKPEDPTIIAAIEAELAKK